MLYKVGTISVKVQQSRVMPGGATHPLTPRRGPYGSLSYHMQGQLLGYPCMKLACAI